MKTVITSYCKIRNNTVYANGKTIVIADDTAMLPDAASFFTNVYRQINMAYPKFFKMDNLCKLGMLAAEIAIQNNFNFNTLERDKVAIVLSNQASSIDTDRNHQKSISDKASYFPSPAVFVYTLPNIIIGEIAIKHKLTGENAFFVSENFDASLIHNYTDVLLNNTQTAAAICGWVNMDGNDYDAFVYCVEKSNFNLDNSTNKHPHSAELIEQLYNKN